MAGREGVCIDLISERLGSSKESLTAKIYNRSGAHPLKIGWPFANWKDSISGWLGFFRCNQNRINDLPIGSTQSHRTGKFTNIDSSTHFYFSVE